MGIESQQQLLVTLLVRVGVVAAIASLLLRSGPFKALLFREERSLPDKLWLGAYLGLMYALGPAVRVTLGYKAPDASLAGAVLTGLLGGHVAGGVAGALMALPVVFRGEALAMPVLLAAGLLGGVARRLSPEVGDRWHFSPFVDLNIYRWYQRRFGKPRGDWQMMFFLWLVLIEIGYLLLGRALPRHLFYLDSPNNWVKAMIVLTGVACVAIPLKVFNNTRNEIILEQQHRLLVEARLTALTSQINPHFLFNTLNSISSLIRLDPEMARVMIHRLSSILRRLLRRQDTFCPLSEELSFTDDYLNIEVVRFGGDKLLIVKEIDDETLLLQVPSMLLQPIVENCIQHGLSPLLSGGMISIRSRYVRGEPGRVRLEVEDNGVGMTADVLAEAPSRGIGLSNVQERLKVLYENDFSFRIHSLPGGGTRVEIELPDLGAPAPQVTIQASAAPAAPGRG